jgi:hypothetical protein
VVCDRAASGVRPLPTLLLEMGKLQGAGVQPNPSVKRDAALTRVASYFER